MRCVVSNLIWILFSAATKEAFKNMESYLPTTSTYLCGKDFFGVCWFRRIIVVLMHWMSFLVLYQPELTRPPRSYYGILSHWRHPKVFENCCTLKLFNSHHNYHAASFIIVFSINIVETKKSKNDDDLYKGKKPLINQLCRNNCQSVQMSENKLTDILRHYEFALSQSLKGGGNVHMKSKFDYKEIRQITRNSYYSNAKKCHIEMAQCPAPDIKELRFESRLRNF